MVEGLLEGLVRAASSNCTTHRRRIRLSVDHGGITETDLFMWEGCVK